jgi:hypothetical protein
MDALCAVLLLGLPMDAAAAPPAARQTMSAGEFVRQVETAGVDVERVDVAGTVDLRRLNRIVHPMRCHDCTIAGSLIGSDVIFERIVDMSGTQIGGSLDLHRASFRAAFLLQATAARPSAVAETVDLNLATFDGQVGFDGARFYGEFTAQNASIAGNASFVESEFLDNTRFDHTVFAEMADFSMSTFLRAATFDRAHINGAAMFGQASFGGITTFVSTSFQERADFTGALFERDTRFTAASFADTTAFRFVESYGLLSLDRARALGVIDLGAADLVGGLSLSALSTEELSLRDAMVDTNADLHMESVHASALLMDIDDVSRIRGSVAREDALKLLEESAKRAGNLVTANNARFELLRLQNSRKQLLARMLDAVFYQSVSGYLVRPSHPMRALILAILLATTLRAIRSSRSGDRPLPVDRGTTPRQRVGAAYARVRYLSTLVWSGFVLSVSRLPGVPGDADTAGASSPDDRWSKRRRAVETLVYRVLFAVLLISIGNSSSTIREVIDAVRA